MQATRGISSGLSAMLTDDTLETSSVAVPDSFGTWFERGLPESVPALVRNQFSVTAGDFYTSWGQGLVLNLKTVDELGCTPLSVVGIWFGLQDVLNGDPGGPDERAESRTFRGSYEVIEDPTMCCSECNLGWCLSRVLKSVFVRSMPCSDAQSLPREPDTCGHRWSSRAHWIILVSISREQRRRFGMKTRKMGGFDWTGAQPMRERMARGSRDCAARRQTVSKI